MSLVGVSLAEAAGGRAWPGQRALVGGERAGHQWASPLRGPGVHSILGISRLPLCQTTTGDRGLYLQVEGGIGALRKRQVFWVRNEATSEPVFSMTRLARLPACPHSQLVFQSLTKQDYKSPVDRVGLPGCVFAGYKISQSLSPSESD